MLHLKEVIVVTVSHVILHCKKIKFIGLMKTISVHLFTGFVLSFLANLFLAGIGPVGVGGGFANNQYGMQIDNVLR